MKSCETNKLVIARFTTNEGVTTNLDVELPSFELGPMRSKLKELQKTTNRLLTKHVEATKAAARKKKKEEEKQNSENLKRPKKNMQNNDCPTKQAKV